MSCHATARLSAIFQISGNYLGDLLAVFVVFSYTVAVFRSSLVIQKIKRKVYVKGYANVVGDV